MSVALLCGVCGLMPSAPVAGGPRLAPHRCAPLLMAEEASSEQQGVPAKPKYRMELLAQDRSAVGSLGPAGVEREQESYVGVPPPGSGVQPAAPSMIQKVKVPFIGLTLMVTALLGAKKSREMYKERQEDLLENFAVTMIANLGDEREMASAIKIFKQQLGPGSHSGPMFVAFLKAFAEEPANIQTILELKKVIGLMQLSPSSLAGLLGEAMDGLQSAPSTLGKLVFVAERAVPQAAQAAQLRTKFPTWSPETVATLQRAMLENLYRDMCEAPGADAPENLQILGLTEGEASRLREDVEEKKRMVAEAEAEKEAELQRGKELEDALKKAAEYDGLADLKKKAEGGGDKSTGGLDKDDDGAPPDEDRAEGTHEYECTKCGYIMFPAAGREFKFYGDDFKCPQPDCGAGKDAFVDNGVIGTLP
jgi:rubrerythrin